MPATGFTPNQNIPIFTEQDTTGWLNGFNPAMNKIDELITAIKTDAGSVDSKIEAANALITSLQEKQTELSGLVAENSSEIDHLTTDVANAASAAELAGTKADAAQALATTASSTAGDALSEAADAMTKANQADQKATKASQLDSIEVTVEPLSELGDASINLSYIKQSLRYGRIFLNLDISGGSREVCEFRIKTNSNIFNSIAEGDPATPIGTANGVSSDKSSYFVKPCYAYHDGVSAIIAIGDNPPSGFFDVVIDISQMISDI